MRCGWLLVGLVLFTSAEAAPRAGRVVRVQHDRPFVGTPELCTFATASLDGYCVGDKPNVGDQIDLLDKTGVVGRLRIEEVKSAGPCQIDTWTVHVQAGFEPRFPGDEHIEGLIGLHAHRGTSLVSVDRVAGNRVVDPDNVVAVDANGDGIPDLEFVSIGCDAQGHPAPSPNQVTTLCLELWRGRGHGFELVRTDRLQQCF